MNAKELSRSPSEHVVHFLCQFLPRTQLTQIGQLKSFMAFAKTQNFTTNEFHLVSWSIVAAQSVIPASKQILVPTIAVKKDGVEAFIKKINQLRGR